MLNMTFPFLLVAPNAVRAVRTRCGVGLMEAVPAGDHHASLSVTGASPRGKMPIRENRLRGGSP
jgi:hypothetical protein